MSKHTVSALHSEQRVGLDMANMLQGKKCWQYTIQCKNKHGALCVSCHGRDNFGGEQAADTREPEQDVRLHVVDYLDD